MDYASEIKSRVSMPEMVRYYGFEVDRAGFCKCPFHSEQTGSLKAYSGDGGFHCFGCGAHGDVVDFVMKYFDIPFREALEKINEDFSVGLPMVEKLSHQKRIDIEKQAFLRKREAAAQKARREELDRAYWAAFDEWKRLDDNRREYRPAFRTDKLHPLFTEAIKNIARAEYELDCAENRRNSCNR